VAPSQLELLQHAEHIDKLIANPDREVPLPELPGQKTIQFEDDPFAGNANNRKVAERIAKERQEVKSADAKTVADGKAAAAANPTGHIENPDKAAADVAAAALAGNTGKTDTNVSESTVKPNFGTPTPWTPNA
jgi:hypothetical protein